MAHKNLNRIVAAVVFLVTLAVYLRTLSCTVVFWDVGEFIAAAKLMQVPHPPGSPLFLYWARVAMMIPFAADQAVRAHAFSALCSALGIMFTYLVVVRLILDFRGKPEKLLDRVVVYGAGAIGAWSLAFTTTYWDNSIEAEVYGASMLFLTAIMWLVMRWRESAEREGNEKYIILIAYVIGLSLGVHLLALLVVIPVLMIVFFRKWEYSSPLLFVGSSIVALAEIGVLYVVFNTVTESSDPRSNPNIVQYVMGVLIAGAACAGFLYLHWNGSRSSRTSERARAFSLGTLFALCAMITQFVIYPGIVKFLPGLMDGEWGGIKNNLIAFIPWVIIALVCYYVYDSYRKKRKILHIALLSVVLICLGYTTYTGVLIRSNTDIPMNENDPSNLARLTSYLGREQYGNSPTFFPRRWSQEPHQQAMYTKYSSDTDYMIRYQLNHMFFRYLGWNYIGQAGDEQDAGISWKETWGIPLLLGLFGFWYQFQKDWKMALVFTAMFIIFGPVLALYQNQQESQPRERDYFYVGAMYVFSVWIAIGLVGVVDYFRKWMKSESLIEYTSYAAVAIFMFAIPVNLARTNWVSHDRSANYVAWDYSYNILQTCEKDAILITNGDNDTFPLWYLQDVEGIRRDVRIVNLSLVNTPWYIHQMKNKPYFPEAKPVPMSLTDAQIDRIQQMAWESRRLDIPVTKEAMEKYGVTDSTVLRSGKISFTFNPTLTIGGVKAIRAQDRMMQDIVFTNQWKRPIYFAVTVSPDSKIGLDDYLWFHGLAWRLEPRRVTDQDNSLDPNILEANLYNEPQGFSTSPQYGYKWRNVADPKVYFDENTSRLMLNYRAAFIRLALYHANVTHDNAKALSALDRMEQLIPRTKVPMGLDLLSFVASVYHRFGNERKFNELVAEIEPRCQDLIASGKVNMNSTDNPYRILLEIYDIEKAYGKSLDLLKSLSSIYPNDPGLKQRIADIRTQLGQQVPGTDSTNKN